MSAPNPASLLCLALADIADRLAAMESHPYTWGDSEALELQWLLLVEMRQRILRPAAIAANPHETRRAYFFGFMAPLLGEARSCPLYVALREEDMAADLPRLLGDAQRWIAREYPPEWNPAAATGEVTT